MYVFRLQDPSLRNESYGAMPKHFQQPLIYCYKNIVYYYYILFSNCFKYKAQQLVDERG